MRQCEPAKQELSSFGGFAVVYSVPVERNGETIELRVHTFDNGNIVVSHNALQAYRTTRNPDEIRQALMEVAEIVFSGEQESK